MIAPSTDLAVTRGECSGMCRTLRSSRATMSPSAISSAGWGRAELTPNNAWLSEAGRRLEDRPRPQFRSLRPRDRASTCRPAALTSGLSTRVYGLITIPNMAGLSAALAIGFDRNLAPSGRLPCDGLYRPEMTMIYDEGQRSRTLKPASDSVSVRSMRISPSSSTTRIGKVINALSGNSPVRRQSCSEARWVGGRTPRRCRLFR